MCEESLSFVVARVQEKLDRQRGCQAKAWYFRFSHSQLVVRLTQPGSPTIRSYLDCISCSRVTFVPAWEPAAVNITIRDPDNNSLLLVEDGDRLRVECESVRIEEMDDNRGTHPIPPTSGLRTWSELVDRMRDAWKGVPVEPTFGALTNFFRGYQLAMLDYQFALKDEDHLTLREFQEWLKQQLGNESGSVDWATAIKLRYGEGDEAYQRFFGLWEHYRAFKHAQYNQALSGP
jgi:hypothetical protein